MRITKGKILQVSGTLFNEKGLSNVSMRTIADELTISPGNLTYHFRKREDIIEALYFELVDNMNEAIAQAQQTGLASIYQMTQAINSILYTYRFIMLDFTTIMRNNKKIKTHFEKLCKLRKVQFTGIINHLIKTGILRQEELPREYEFLYYRFQLIGDYWVSSAEILHQKIAKKHIELYNEIILQSLYPYLTKKGRNEYHALMKSILI